jgi:hypothetical protein
MCHITKNHLCVSCKGREEQKAKGIVCIDCGEGVFDHEIYTKDNHAYVNAGLSHAGYKTWTIVRCTQCKEDKEFW